MTKLLLAPYIYFLMKHSLGSEAPDFENTLEKIKLIEELVNRTE